ncbi:hypothetical protein BN873_10244 [Candidatus Competibacter denitrificans Run_A_D11]|uniref:Uncharacterized protein n=1 Tax=Candidatus Competibacter denitrificans Run_A_D11 TaxID=1400863 RepID=W6MAY9_9GAMM|nr:hypothetical protein BN873_10244 [Candidatus Competibacter denitrificans Run_A_D11]
MNSALCKPAKDFCEVSIRTRQLRRVNSYLYNLLIKIKFFEYFSEPPHFVKFHLQVSCVNT